MNFIAFLKEIERTGERNPVDENRWGGAAIFLNMGGEGVKIN